MIFFCRIEKLRIYSVVLACRLCQICADGIFLYPRVSVGHKMSPWLTKSASLALISIGRIRASGPACLKQTLLRSLVCQISHIEACYCQPVQLFSLFRRSKNVINIVLPSVCASRKSNGFLQTPKI